MDKIRKTASTLDTVVKVLQVFAKIGFVAAVVSVLILTAALLFDLNPELVGTGYAELELGQLTLTLADAGILDIKAVMISGLLTMVLTALSIAMVIPAFQRIRNILAPMTEGAVFQASVSKEFKKLGWLAIAIGVVQNVTTVASSAVMTFYLRVPDILMELFKDGTVTHMNVEAELQLSFLVVAAVLFLMGYIFDYGTQLQQLSDETL